ncbi:nucleotidyl transferase [Clostridium sp. CAG:967]|nr:nucleotidyl transferase [Clostridium sp. CAG:967]
MSEKIKAMIMSAGVGSRLDPLTKFIPKPLVPVANKPVMDILFEKLLSYGITDVICNTYYLADKIIDRYKENNLGINFNYIKEETLSGTAGGVKKCQYFFDNEAPFVVLSADGLSNADIKKGIDVHKKSNAVATIGIKKIAKEEVPHFGVVVTDNDGFITEFQEKPSVEEAKSNYINTGIYIFDYKIFDYIPENTFYDFAKNVFPELLKEHAINTFEISEYWSDIGTLEQYKQSTTDLFNGLCSFAHSPIKSNACASYISDTSFLPEDVKFKGFSTIGKDCKIGNNSVIDNSIIWDNVVIEDGVVVSNSVIASGCIIKGDVYSSVIGANEVITEQALKI